MKKLMVVLLAAAMIASVSGAALAAVQNVRLGGDIRTRAYYTKNLYSVDSETDNDDFYFRQRTRVSAEADLTDNVWVVATVEADGLWGNQRVASGTRLEEQEDGSYVEVPTYSKVDNDWDVKVAEAYIQLSEIAYSPWTTKFGRQYLNYGRGFLISSREWEYKFDAWRNILDFYPWTIDLLYSRLVESDQWGDGGVDKGGDDEDLYGLNLKYEEDFWTMEGYAFGIRDSLDEEYGDGMNSPVAVGFRFDASPVEAFDIWGEFAYQLGNYQTTFMAQSDIDEQSIRAYGFDVGAVYVFDVSWEPAIALSYTYGSGDDGGDAENPRKKMFDPMFNYNYYGYAYSPQLSNIGILNAQVSLLPSDAWTLILDFYYYTQAKERDMVMGNPRMDNGGVNARTNGEEKDLGMELDVILEYDYTEDVSMQLVGAWFKPGDAYNTPENEDNPDDVFEARLEVRVSF